MAIDRREFLSAATLAAGALAAPQSQARSSATPSDATPLDARSHRPAVATEALAAHTARLQFAELDQATLRKAKLRVLDLIGCAIGGTRSPGISALVDLVQVQGGKPESSVIGFPVRAPAAQVAMANAVIARAYDFEVMTVAVGNLQVASHHSPTTCMTALAMCERDHLPGKSFLTALVLGDDICARLLAASGLDFSQGWDGAPVYSAIGATAIAAHLMRLPVQQVQDSFGLTVDTISGTVQNIWDGATDWKLPQGLAARNGIVAAELAKRGWVGVGDALLAPYGFYTQYTAGCTRPELITAGLGTKFYAEEYFKPYPACAATHATIECALALKQNNQLAVSDIVRLEIRMPARSLSVFVSKPFEARRHPHCDANFSHQWQAAAALIHGSIRQEHYAPEAIQAPELMALIATTHLAPLPAEQTGIEIAAWVRDGRVLVERHSGTPRHNPAAQGSSRDEILAKFRQQVAFAGYVPPHIAEQIIRRTDALESEADMADFAHLVTQVSLRT